MLIVLPNAFGDAATNMAIDAALLQTLPHGAVAFRHYGWTEPSITFGYSQRLSDVRVLAPKGIALCRRMTGGGMVDHRDDWTYALIMQRAAQWATMSSTQLYETLHRSLAEALAKGGVQTELAPCPRQCGLQSGKPLAPDQCFVQPVMNDVLGPDGGKIAGAAMKRCRKGLLIQGSIDRNRLPEDLDYNALLEYFVQRLSAHLDLPREEPDDLRPFFSSTVIAQEKEKFASPAWIDRR